MRKKDDKSIFKKFTINIIILDEVDKILNFYVSTHNQNFCLYFINCKFMVDFDNLTNKIDMGYCCNLEFYKINMYLLHDINIYVSKGHKFL